MTWYNARWFRSAIIFVVVTTMVGSVAGLSTDAPPEGAPETFGTAESLPGDALLYKTALVVVEDGDARWIDMNAQRALARLDDRWLLDGLGEPYEATSFVAEWSAEAFPFHIAEFVEFGMDDCMGMTYGTDWGRSGDWGDQAEWQRCMDSMGARGMAWAEWGISFAAYMSQQHTLTGASWRVTHHDQNGTDQATTLRSDDPLTVSCTTVWWGACDTRPSTASTSTTPTPNAGPCGWKHDLQAQQQDLWMPIVVHGQCPPAMHLGFSVAEPIEGPIEMRVSGKDRVGERDTVVFALPEDPDSLRIWFAADVPYPVRTLTRIEAVPEDLRQHASNVPEFYVLHEMIEFTRGESAEPSPSPTFSPPSPRSITGPDETGFDHPWPLAEAFEDARTTMTYTGLRDFLATRPDAIVVHADWSYEETPDPDHHEPVVDEAWTFIVAGDGDARLFTAERHTETRIDNRTVSLVPVTVREPLYDFDDEPAEGGWPTAATSPELLPTVVALTERLALFTERDATGWSFSMPCRTCQADDVRLRIGSLPADASGDGPTDALYVDANGALLLHEQSPTSYPDPRFTDPAWDPAAARTPWGWNVASQGVWNWPEPVTAAAGAGLGIAGALLYLLWPAIKALGAVPMFSRISRDDLLEHPVRNDIHALVADRPGIHFQEIVRQVEKGRGTTEHHLRKLVQAELVVEKAHRGFTCYFPKGQVDRRLMAAAPTLKAKGARQVLQAIVSQPGAVAQDISQALGISPSTVNYHVKKLEAAGLVDGARSGRAIRLTPTAIGQQAFTQFVHT